MIDLIEKQRTSIKTARSSDEASFIHQFPVLNWVIDEIKYFGLAVWYGGTTVLVFIDENTLFWNKVICIII
jgi:hypothetical protein